MPRRGSGQERHGRRAGLHGLQRHLYLRPRSPRHTLMFQVMYQADRGGSPEPEQPCGAGVFAHRRSTPRGPEWLPNAARGCARPPCSSLAGDRCAARFAVHAGGGRRRCADDERVALRGGGPPERVHARVPALLPSAARPRRPTGPSSPRSTSGRGRGNTEASSRKGGIRHENLVRSNRRFGGYAASHVRVGLGAEHRQHHGHDRQRIQRATDPGCAGPHPGHAAGRALQRPGEVPPPQHPGRAADRARPGPRVRVLRKDGLGHGGRHVHGGLPARGPGHRRGGRGGHRPRHRALRTEPRLRGPGPGHQAARRGAPAQHHLRAAGEGRGRAGDDSEQPARCLVARGDPRRVVVHGRRTAALCDRRCAHPHGDRGSGSVRARVRAGGQPVHGHRHEQRPGDLRAARRRCHGALRLPCRARRDHHHDEAGAGGHAHPLHLQHPLRDAGPRPPGHPVHVHRRAGRLLLQRPARGLRRLVRVRLLRRPASMRPRRPTPGDRTRTRSRPR